MRENLTIGFIGNPNCGKTTLFNAYTGANLKVANWPGVTVEKVEGAIKDHDLNIRLVDLPGTYSLTSYTMEEQVSRQFILSDEVDVIIDVADASALERNLYLTLQLLELGKPVVLALNMMDIVEKRGMEIDTHRLPEMLGIPVIPVSARKRTGLDVLLHAAAHHKDCKDPECLIHHHKYKPKHRHDHHSEYAMVYSDAIEDKIDLIMAELKRKYPNLTNYRWHAIKLLEQDKEISERYPVSLPDVIDRNYESDIINEKYDFIQEIIREVLVNKDRQDALTEKVDRALTHRVWGIPIFLGIMAVVFFLTFTIGDWLKGYFEMGIESLSALLSDGLVAAGVNEMLRSLLVDGIVAGVGGILTFLPNIFILFLALAFLEDSGYMARVAYVMEGIMSKLGLSGRAFIPMILGFGCTVPAIMASRALENRRDRFKVMLITPFMSCSARLPIYILFSKPKFASMMQEKINMKVDTSMLDQEIANHEKQLRQFYSIKSKLMEEIDSLDPDDRHYFKRKADLDDRLYRMYDKIEDEESQMIEARAKRQAIEAEKLTGDNIYKVLMCFDKLYSAMNDVERRRVMEALISEIQIHEDRQPNGQWLKSIRFRLPIIEEDMNLSLDNNEHVETVCLLSKKP